LHKKSEELDPEDKNDVAASDRPSWPQEGWLRIKQKGSKYLIGAAGVVVKPSTHFFSGSLSTTPSAAIRY
jgi:hypothetical protein